jgi:hypothetical protein
MRLVSLEILSPYLSEESKNAPTGCFMGPSHQF